MTRAKYVGPANTDVDLLTTAEVAGICRAPVSTIRYWRHIGTGPASFRLGRRVVYRRADVHSWIHSQLAGQARTTMATDD